MRTLTSLVGISLLLVACADDTKKPIDDQGIDKQIVSDYIVGPDSTDDAGVEQDTSVDGGGADTGSKDSAAVDAYVSPDLGSTATPGICRRAPKVTLVGGEAVIEDDTSKYDDEFSGLVCGGGTYDDLYGGQAYYRFDGKKDRWYRFSITPTFSALIYVFTNPTCTEATIEADCASEGATGDISATVYSGSPRTLYFKAPQDGEIYVAVDSKSSYSEGAFTLKINEITTPANTTCSTAAQLAFVDGKAISRGDVATAFAADEFSAVSCGSSSSYDAFDGPQVYYSFAGTRGKSYKITLKPDAASSLYFYVFGSTCTETAIETDCASAGATGDVMDSSASSPNSKSIIFSPGQDGTYTIAVDTRSDTAGGSFTLSVEDYDLPPNFECTTAQPLSFVNGKATIQGDTVGMRNEYADSITCGSYTSFDGEQAYFELNAQAGKYYSFDATTEYTSGYIYGFQKSNCGSVPAINTDCGSDGQQGFRVTGSTSGKQFIFKPTAPGAYIFAVDSSTGGYAGPFSMTVEERDAPANDTCTAATALDLSSGSASVQASTMGATSEFGDAVKCGGSTAYDGPQIYYSFEVKADRGYRINVRPTYGAYMYVFQQSSCSGAASINLDCDSAGAAGFASGYISSNSTKEFLFRPTAPGIYVIGIDSSDLGTFGDLSLTVEEVVPPTNQVCAQATALSFTNDKAHVSGSTAFALDDLAISCGKPEYFDGPQVYYELTAEANKSYWIKFTPTFSDAYLYIFGNSCVAADVNAACSSGGTSGDVVGPVHGTARSFYFTPTTPGVYTIAVDSNLSTYADEFGDFELDIEAFSAPTNGSCAAAETVTFVDNAATVSGFTTGGSNEFAGAIACGGTVTFDGPQAYYKAALQGGVKYILRASTDFEAEVYYFRDSANCQATGIEADCGGTDPNLGGHFSLTAGYPKTFSFVPPTSGTYVIAIDSPLATESGRYELSLSAFVVPTLTAPFTFDFEATGGGLAATGDWEYGQVAFVGNNCDSYLDPVPPTNGLGHDNQQRGMWATVLNNCYTNAGNDDGYGGGCDVGDPTDDSILAFRVTIPSTATSAKLVLEHWLDGSTDFDHPAIFVDGAVVEAICPYFDDPMWEHLEIDLAAYIGKTSLVELHWVATAGSNRAGWYIDQLGVTIQ